MAPDLIKLLIESGALATCLVVILYWNRKDAERREKRDQERIKEEREDKLLMIATLQGNTSVLSELTTIVKRMNGK